MELETIDKAVFAELRATVGGPRFMAGLVATFLDETPLMLADMRRARDEDDGPRFRRLAQALKNNSSAFGVRDTVVLACALEIAGLGSDPARDHAALDLLEAAWQRAAVALQELARAGASPN